MEYKSNKFGPDFGKTPEFDEFKGDSVRDSDVNGTDVSEKEEPQSFAREDAYNDPAQDESIVDNANDSLADLFDDDDDKPIHVKPAPEYRTHNSKSSRVIYIILKVLVLCAIVATLALQSVSRIQKANSLIGSTQTPTGSQNQSHIINPPSYEPVEENTEPAYQVINPTELKTMRGLELAYWYIDTFGLDATPFENAGVSEFNDWMDRMEQEDHFYAYEFHTAMDIIKADLEAAEIGDEEIPDEEPSLGDDVTEGDPIDINWPFGPTDTDIENPDSTTEGQPITTTPTEPTTAEEDVKAQTSMVIMPSEQTIPS